MLSPHCCRLCRPQAVDLRARADTFMRTYAMEWRGTPRNQDDSFGYQDVCDGSAPFLSFGHTDGARLERATAGRPAVEWAKAQLTPTLHPINYGIGGELWPIDSLAIGAFIFGDEESRYLLQGMLQRMDREGVRHLNKSLALWLLRDQPPARQYHFGSSLIAAPTGYDFNPGVSAVDKLVLRRESPSAEGLSRYLLLDLRNQGWHRFPATGAVLSLTLGDASAVGSDIHHKSFSWLPAGRATYRDKKIDRADLSASQVERVGLDKWIGAITNVYSSWDQNVPYFSDVVGFGATGGTESRDLAVGPLEQYDTSPHRVFAMKPRIFVFLDRVTGPSGVAKARFESRGQHAGFDDDLECRPSQRPWLAVRAFLERRARARATNRRKWSVPRSFPRSHAEHRRLRVTRGVRQLDVSGRRCAEPGACLGIGRNCSIHWAAPRAVWLFNPGRTVVIIRYTCTTWPDDHQPRSAVSATNRSSRWTAGPLDRVDESAPANTESGSVELIQKQPGVALPVQRSSRRDPDGLAAERSG